MGTSNNLESYRVSALPENLDKQMLVEAMLHRQFAMHHDLLSRRTFLMASPDVETLLYALSGFEIEAETSEISAGNDILYLVASGPRDGTDVIGNLYRLFGRTGANVVVVFTPIGQSEAVGVKLKTERLLSDKETGSTESVSTKGSAISQTASRHKESFRDSEEKDFLASTLETLKSAVLSKGGAYKIAIFLSGEYGGVYDYLNSKLTILEETKIETRGIGGVCDVARRRDAMPFDSAGAAKMIGFSGNIRINRAVGTALPESEGEISLGHVMDGSVKEEGEEALTDSSAFNLGTLISGVPGTGKTFAAMRITEQLLGKKIGAVIISPTDEWNAFGNRNGLKVIRLLRPESRFNFFKCEDGTDITKFNENLAMLLASASDAGPYTNTLEKCMLAAFRRIYAEGRAPDPVSVYEEIEEAIIEQHGKRSTVGVKYTKHGENARAALANLRAMLNRPELSKKDGLSFSELLSSGVVFDLSRVSNKMKQFYYALILNQVYGLTDALDTLGDNSLRMLICLEEAQTVFKHEENSAATADLTQRIQDFRKKSVGLMLVTHSVTDIEPEIRRLCQTKLYFRQSADVARFAANDLLFGEAEKDALIERLKSLEQRVCAVDYLQGRERALAGFVKLPEIQLVDAATDKDEDAEAAEGRGDMIIRILDKEGAVKEGVKLRIFYVGEKICDGETGQDGRFRIDNTIGGNAYKLVVLGEKKRDNKTFSIVGGELNIVKI